MTVIMNLRFLREHSMPETTVIIISEIIRRYESILLSQDPHEANQLILNKAKNVFEGPSTSFTQWLIC